MLKGISGASSQSSLPTKLQGGKVRAQSGAYPEGSRELTEHLQQWESYFEGSISERSCHKRHLPAPPRELSCGAYIFHMVSLLVQRHGSRKGKRDNKVNGGKRWPTYPLWIETLPKPPFIWWGEPQKPRWPHTHPPSPYKPQTFVLLRQVGAEKMQARNTPVSTLNTEFICSK